ncbi:glycoside hydrolase [Podospora aff. communis PSN243]|uniref:Glycoside hydrolase n=1 Tax=Podospora aff. communis PSN243 TaxID=3040156 RepID=A0AAV9GNF1_9PEZI|nr:glycoside hydrolase [Podospora aff. communis PSN243]
MGFMNKFKDFVHKEFGLGSGGRKVFAHYMVGLTCSQHFEQWKHDVVTAKEVGIDGFALNIGPSDPWTQEQLDMVYHVAEEVEDFVLFISFDMAVGEWPVSQVVELINRYKSSKAQMLVDGDPFVSTFEGPAWADNWGTVRQETGGIFLVPDWSSIGPYGVGEKLDMIDGAFSWDAWPKAGCTRIAADEDKIYQQCLKGKKYVMPVSPCFYTKLPQWNKNWYCSSESLWYDRWQQVLEVKPDYVQIITWNDYGESSYICDTVPAQIVPGAEKYTLGYSHTALRAMLPYFIAAYKAGSDIDLPGEETAVAWYRTTPVTAGPDGDTQWGQGGCDSAARGARDVVSIVALTMESRQLTVVIGQRVWYFQTNPNSRVSYFEVPFDSRTVGSVRIALGQKYVDGPPIVNECCHGEVIFNHVAIKV